MGDNGITLDAHTGNVQSIAFSPDGRRLVSGSQDGTVRLWDVATGRELHKATLPGECRGVAFSPDGKTLATGGYPGYLVIRDATSLAELVTCRDSGFVYCLAFSPDGKTLASGTYSGLPILWDIPAGRKRCSLEGGAVDAFPSVPITCVCFSADSTLVAVSSQNLISLWDGSSGTFLGKMMAPEWVHGLSFHPSGKTLASRSSDGTVKLWDALTFKETASFASSGARRSSMTYDPDGRALLFAAADGNIRIMDAANGADLALLKGDRSRFRYTVEWVAWSPDGTTLAAAGRNFIRLIKAPSGW